jgi:hypothetical protein
MSAGRPFRRSVGRGKTVVVSPEIPDAASPRQKEGAARRRLVATTGKCPCGAEMAIPADLKPGSITTVRVEHENDCPAIEGAN